MIDFPLSLMIGTMDVLVGGLLDRFPTLRLAMLEGGVGWVPWWLDRLDEHFELLPNHMPRMKRPASETIAEGRILFSCEPEERHLAYAAQVLGDDKILYASDYPHWDCAFPNSARHIAERPDLPPDTRRRILGENAARFFNLRVPVPA
jgi:predicted TIM-barrel fold metal-dependent hydrolase